MNRDKVIGAIHYAKNILQGNGQIGLIDKPSLKFVGENSPHSMRYAYAKSAEAYYLEQDFNQNGALAKVSIDLGHGDVILIGWLVALR